MPFRDDEAARVMLLANQLEEEREEGERRLAKLREQVERERESLAAERAALRERPPFRLRVGPQLVLALELIAIMIIVVLSLTSSS